MFTKTEVRNNRGGLLTLQLGGVSSGITVQDVSGLDPVKATIVSSAFANQDGAVYQSSRRETRNITFKLGLSPDPAVDTVRSLRRQVYNFFSPKSEVVMKFFVDDVDDSVEDGYQVLGRVESCESPMFTQEPIVNISIICFDPDFIDPIPVTLTGLSTTDVTPHHISYLGSSETGILLTLNVNRVLSQFTLYYTDANSVTWSMDVVGSFIAGDVVAISTVPGNKYATLVRSGVITPVLYAVSPQSIWPELAPGDNWLRVYATGAAIPATVTYTTRYGGL